MSLKIYPATAEKLVGWRAGALELGGEWVLWLTPQRRLKLWVGEVLGRAEG